MVPQSDSSSKATTVRARPVRAERQRRPDAQGGSGPTWAATPRMGACLRAQHSPPPGARMHGWQHGAQDGLPSGAVAPPTCRTCRVAADPELRIVNIFSEAPHCGPGVIAVRRHVVRTLIHVALVGLG